MAPDAPEIVLCFIYRASNVADILPIPLSYSENTKNFFVWFSVNRFTNVYNLVYSSCNLCWATKNSYVQSLCFRHMGHFTFLELFELDYIITIHLKQNYALQHGMIVGCYIIHIQTAHS